MTEYKTKLSSAIDDAIVMESGDNEAADCMVAGRKQIKNIVFLKKGIYLMLKNVTIIKNTKLASLPRYAMIAGDRHKTLPTDIPTTWGA